MERIDIWRAYTPDGSDPSEPPYKTIRGSNFLADATEAPQWLVSAGSINLN